MAKPMIRNEIRFILNGEDVALSSVAPDETLLDYLRLRRSLRGTKEGCAEGDCGACTVLVGRLSGGGLVYESVNACIRFMGSLDGCHVVTVEHLRGADGSAAPGAAGDGRFPRLAMRLLHAGLRHVALRAVDEVAGSVGRGDREGAAGQSLPLHRLRGDHARRARHFQLRQGGEGSARRRARGGHRAACSTR